MPFPSPRERLFGRVDRSGDCWVWLGAVSNGYGRIGVGQQMWYTHRLAYELLVGPIPGDLTVDHLCGQKLCLRPDHLELVTRAENTARNRTATACRNRTQCPHGHPYDEPNTYRTPKGYRRCRSCARTSETLRKRRMAAA